MTTYLDALDDQQREAATHPGTPLVVYAGAGSGKTALLTSRIAYQIDTEMAEPDKMFACTFTKAAAGEMLQRVESIVDSDGGLVISTFHSLMYRFLNEERTAAGEGRLDVCKDYERKNIIKDLLGRPSKEYPKAINFKADLAMVLGCIAKWKSNLINAYDEEIAATVAEAGYGTDMWAAAQVYPLYEESLKKKGKVDFDDMILKTHNLLTSNPNALSRAHQKWNSFFLDEAQDLSSGTWRLIDLIAQPSLEPNITIVGDTRQALYRFTSAVPELMDDFERRYKNAKRIDLVANYRSTKAIVRSANELAKPFMLKDQATSRTEGQKPIIAYMDNEYVQAQQVVELVKKVKAKGGLGGDVAVLVRTNAQTAAIESAFVSAGLPYWCRTGGFFQRMEIGVLMAYLRLIEDNTDFDALSQIINKPTRYLGAAFVEQVRSNASKFNGNLVQAMRITDTYASRKMSYKQREEAIKLADLITHYSGTNGMGVSSSSVIEGVLHSTDFIEWLKTDQGISEGADNSKLENIDKLKGEIALQHSSISSLLRFADETTRLQRESGDSTEICTYHAAKGREFPIVFMSNFYEKSVPHLMAIQDGHIVDELRIAYVGFTRAQDTLIVAVPRHSEKYREVEPSRFIRNLLLDSDQIVDVTEEPDWLSRIRLDYLLEQS